MLRIRKILQSYLLNILHNISFLFVITPIPNKHQGMNCKIQFPSISIKFLLNLGNLKILFSK